MFNEFHLRIALWEKLWCLITLNQICRYVHILNLWFKAFTNVHTHTHNLSFLQDVSLRDSVYVAEAILFLKVNDLIVNHVTSTSPPL